MSLNSKYELSRVAKVICRELGKNSTSAEKIFWEAVRDRKLLNKKFYRQYPIFYDLNGRESFFVADFYYYERKLIIELDGPVYEFQLGADKERAEILNMLGITVIRFKNEQVENNLQQVLNELKTILK
jgi:very-short-patch-repair endonuclease